MISALLLLTLAQTPMDYGPKWEGQPIIRPRVDRSEGPLRMTRLGADDYAFFEAFPASGVGAGASCPVANWAIYSDETDNSTYWSPLTGGGPPAATFISGSRTSPIGTATADEWQFYAQSAGAAYSFRTNGTALANACAAGQPCAYAIWVKGVSPASGTIHLCAVDTTPTGSSCTPCAYTSAWSRCTASLTFSGASDTKLAFGYPTGTALAADSTIQVWNAYQTPAPAVGDSATTTTTPNWGPNPTGAQGEVLTFARGSTATCTKTATGGLATSGIANGDLVLVPSNQPRVMYDANGTLGLLVESQRTNLNLRSEQINDAWWTDITAGGAAAPTLNGANAGASPFGTITAEDYTFPATAAGQDSGRIGTSNVACNGTACTHSVFVRGVSSGGTLDLCAWDTFTPNCTPCVFTTTSWTRCVHTATNAGNVATFIGNNTLWNGGTARSLNRVLLSGTQMEVGGYATSYIPTVAASVTRSAEVAYFDTVDQGGGTFSLAATRTGPAVWSSGLQGYASWTDAIGSGAPAIAIINNGGSNPNCYFSVDSYLTLNGALTSPQRTYCYKTIGAQLGGANSNGTLVTGAAAGLTSARNFVFLGQWSNTSPWADGIISRVCADNTAERCR